MTSKAPRFSDDRQILSEEATWVKCEKSSDQTSFHRWIFALLFGVIVIVITVQQYQLMTIQRELNILNQFEEASTVSIKVVNINILPPPPPPVDSSRLIMMSIDRFR